MKRRASRAKRDFARLIRRFRLSIRVSHGCRCHVTWVNRTHLGIPARDSSTGKRPRMSFRARRSVANERASICKVAEFPKLATTRPRKQGRNARARTWEYFPEQINAAVCGWEFTQRGIYEMSLRSTNKYILRLGGMWTLLNCNALRFMRYVKLRYE